MVVSGYLWVRDAQKVSRIQKSLRAQWMTHLSLLPNPLSQKPKQPNSSAKLVFDIFAYFSSLLPLQWPYNSSRVFMGYNDLSGRRLPSGKEIRCERFLF